MATIENISPQELAADRKLAAILASSRFRYQGNFGPALSILEEYPKLAHRPYRSAYPSAKIPPLCCILTSYVSCSLQVIQSVFKLNPSAVLEPQGRNQDTALHFACRHGATVPVVEFIYSKNPAAILTLNGSGRPPLECLLPRLQNSGGVQSSLLVMDYLLQASPKAALLKNRQGQNLAEAASSLGGWSSNKALSSYWILDNTDLFSPLSPSPRQGAFPATA